MAKRTWGLAAVVGIVIALSGAAAAVGIWCSSAMVNQVTPPSPAVTDLVIPGVNVVWARSLGSSRCWERPTALLAGPLGNVLVAGETFGNMSRPNKRVNLRTMKEVFLAKYGPAGELVWVRQFGTRGFDEAHSIATGLAGDCYVVGKAHGTKQWGDIANDGDMFLAKFTADGREEWVRRYPPAGGGLAYGLAVGADGGIYVAGRLIAPEEQKSADEPKALVAKYDAAGEPVWVHSYSDGDAGKVETVFLDGDANSYVVHSQPPTDANAPTRTCTVTADDPSGRQLWQRTLELQKADEVVRAVADAAGGCFVLVRQPAERPSGEGTFALVGCGSADQPQWRRQILERASASLDMVLDADGNCYVIGDYQFRGKALGELLAKYDRAGQEIARLTVTGDGVLLQELTVSREGNCIIAGMSDAPPGEASGNSDLLVAKIQIP